MQYFYLFGASKIDRFMNLFDEGITIFKIDKRKAKLKKKNLKIKFPFGENKKI